jgi:hypothetical protein
MERAWSASRAHHARTLRTAVAGRPSSMANDAVVAASGARAVSNVLTAFRLADATAPARARPLAALGVRPSRTVAKLERVGAIRPGTEPATCYLDERAWLAHQRGAQSRATVVALAAGLLALGLAVGALFITR